MSIVDYIRNQENHCDEQIEEMTMIAVSAMSVVSLSRETRTLIFLFAGGCRLEAVFFELTGSQAETIILIDRYYSMDMQDDIRLLFHYAGFCGRLIFINVCNLPYFNFNNVDKSNATLIAFRPQIVRIYGDKTDYNAHINIVMHMCVKENIPIYMANETNIIRICEKEDIQQSINRLYS